MSALYWLAMQPLVQRLGWTLVHSLWQGAAVALLLAVFFCLSRSGDARLRYAFACAALFAFTLCPPFTFWMLSQERSAPTVTLADHSDRQSANVASFLPADSGQQGDDAASRAALAGIVTIWLGGSLALSVRLFGGWSRLSRLRRTGQPASLALQRRVNELAARMGVRREIHFLLTIAADAPSTFGWVRPVLLLPAAALSGLSTDQVDAILAHELAHIRRADYLVNLWQTAAETLFYYHPAVWWISATIRREREFCCDDIAVQMTGDVAAYATALATLEEMRPMALVPRLAATGGPLLERVRRILGEPGDRPVSTRGIAAVPVLAALGLACTIAAGVWAAGPAFGRTMQDAVAPKLPTPPTPPAPPVAVKPAQPAQIDLPAVPQHPARPSRARVAALPTPPLTPSSPDVPEPPIVLRPVQDDRQNLTDDQRKALARARKEQAKAREAEQEALEHLEAAREAQKSALRDAQRARQEALRSRAHSRLRSRGRRSADEARTEAEDAQSKGDAAHAEALRREAAAASRLDPVYDVQSEKRQDTTSADVARERHLQARDTLERAQAEDIAALKRARSRDVLRREELRGAVSQSRAEDLRAQRDALQAERDALRSQTQQRAERVRGADEAAPSRRTLDALRQDQARRAERSAELQRELRERSAERAAEARERSRQVLESVRSARSRSERAATDERALTERVRARERGRGDEVSVRNQELQSRIRQMEERTRALEQRLEEMQRRLERDSRREPERIRRVDPTRERREDSPEKIERARAKRDTERSEPRETDPTRPEKPVQP